MFDVRCSTSRHEEKMEDGETSAWIDPNPEIQGLIPDPANKFGLLNRGTDRRDANKRLSPAG